MDDFPSVSEVSDSNVKLRAPLRLKSTNRRTPILSDSYEYRSGDGGGKPFLVILAFFFIFAENYLKWRNGESSFVGFW